MKPSLAKTIGLGCWLAAGPVYAGDVPVVNAVVIPSVQPAPAFLPVEVRSGTEPPRRWVSSGQQNLDAVWLPARGPSEPAPPSLVAPAVKPPVVPPVATAVTRSEPITPTPAEIGPRLAPGATPLGPLPAIPAVPEVRVAPAAPQRLPLPVNVETYPVATQVPPRVVTDQPEPPLARPPQPSSDGPPRIPPAVENPLPAPRLLYPPQPEPEPYYAPLPVAPPELMIPAGYEVPGKRGTFGSPPLSLSRDYPPLAELLTGGWFTRRGDRAVETTGTPATDRLSFRAEYLLWWVNNPQIPVLASTSTNGGFGFLGDPGTRTLLGPGSFGTNPRHGLRVRGGYWHDDCGTWGLDAGYFFLGGVRETATFDPVTFPTITRPIFAPNLNAEFGEIVALPNFSSGVLRTESRSSLWGFDANARHALCKTCEYRSEVFAGYRFLGLDERLGITEFISSLPGNPNDPVGTNVVVRDQFATENRFHGGQIGYAAERNWGRVSLDGRASVAFGTTFQTVDIRGVQVRQRPGMATPDLFNGGLLAAGPNLGTFERDRFSVVPEVTLNLGYRLTPAVKAYVGYNFLYWTNVVRPGDQIDRVVDVTFVPNPPPNVAPSGQLRPQPTFKPSDLAINGLQFGVQWRW